MIIIYIKGGLIEGVERMAGKPDTMVLTIDRDVEGADPDEITPLSDEVCEDNYGDTYPADGAFVNWYDIGFMSVRPMSDEVAYIIAQDEQDKE